MLLILLGGISSLRIFETYFIKQTELELNAQAAFISAIYAESYAEIKGKLKNEPFRISEEDVQWEPIKSILDRASSPILDEAPLPLQVNQILEKHELAAGQSIIRIMQKAQKKTLASMRVLNKSGIVVGSSNLKKHISLTNRPEVRAALLGENQAVLRRRTLTQEDPSYGSISRGADLRVHVAQPIFLNNEVIGAVVLARTPTSLYQVMGRYWLDLIIYISVLILLIWLLSLFTSYTIKQPLIALVRQAKRAERGEKGAMHPLKNPVSHEISELSISFASMAQTLEKRADYLLEFTSHISHEFKTPVTAIQGAAELMIDHLDDMSLQDRKRFLSNLQDDAKHLEKLVLRLLDFAKADLKKSNQDSCYLQNEISSILNYYQRNDIQIDCNFSYKEKLTLNMSSEDFQCIMSNLIDNAIQAKAEHIHIKPILYPNYIEIQVIDDGEMISEGNRNKIFSPFFTSKKQLGGTGLGLSIIQSILNTYGGEINLKLEKNTKIFSIMLK